MRHSRSVIPQRFLLLAGVIFIALLWGGAAQATVNVNIASVGELESMPGISKTVAERIVEYRNDHGPFSSLEQLSNVKGVGKGTLEKIKDLIVFDMAPIATQASASGDQPKQPTASEVLAKFNHEPTISEVQKAAVRSAKIHPEDIDRWRSRIKLSSLVPQTKVRVDYYTRENSTYRVTQNINFQNEPDRYVIGPDEYSIYNYDYDYVKYQLQLGWDLNEFVFNKEELRIRKESEDLVDFMTKVVEDVTKLYFERRRLQVNLVLMPDTDPRLRIEKELRLQELTSLLDMATGGFFLERLNASQGSR